MTIDIHVHMGTYQSIEDAGDKLTTRRDVASFRSKYPELYNEYVTQPPLDNSRTLLRVMDEYGIEKTLIQPRPGIDNEFVAKMAETDRRRLVPLALPTPWPTPADGPEMNAGDLSRRSADLLAHCFDNLGMDAAGELYVRRITSEIHPEKIADDLSPVMEILEKKEAAVQIPTAWTQFPGGLYYGDPLWVDEVASRFPRVPIVLTKMGRGFQRIFDSCMLVALRNRNVFFDTSDTRVEHLRAAIDTLGADRILFGTDWSATWQFLQHPGTAHSLALDTVRQATSDKGEQELILFRNTQRVYASALS